MNASIQLMYCLPEVRKFFINQEYKINQDESADLIICDEMSRIFKSTGQYVESAAYLRILVGDRSGNPEICSGRQQDVTDFLRLLLKQIEIELAELDGPQALFINKFWGREHIVKKFANGYDGKCTACGNLPRKENEDFNIMKLEVINTNTPLSLNSIIENSFSEGTDVFKMKCSECCPHLVKCPLTGNCRLKNAVDQKQLFRTPSFLFIQLLRFEHFSSFKTKTTVVPEDILTLPNGEQYMLTGSADHLGDLIKNGHYESNVKSGDSWIKCNDEKLTRTVDIITPNNYVFLYNKIKPNVIPVGNENKEYQTNIVCNNCRKNVTDLEKHYDEYLICKQTAGFKTCKVNLPRILISETKDNQKVNVFCPNCNTSVKSLEHHFNVSLICKQAKLIQDNQKNKTKPEKNPVIDDKKTNKVPLKSKLSFKKVKCTFCQKEFPNINQHLSKSFPCQNAYKIDDMIHKSFESDDSIESIGPPLKKRKEDKGCREKYECSGCKKNYLNIWLHLKKTEGCQKHYDMFKVEEDHKETLRVKKSLKMQKYRKSKGDEKRKQDFFFIFFLF